MKLSASAIAKAMSQADVSVTPAEDTVTPLIREFPKVGDSVAVVHRSDLNAAGFAVLADAPLMPSEVVAVLEGGFPFKRIRVASGDVWDVALAGSEGKGAKWITKRVRYAN